MIIKAKNQTLIVQVDKYYQLLYTEQWTLGELRAFGMFGNLQKHKLFWLLIALIMHCRYFNQ